MSWVIGGILVVGVGVVIYVAVGLGNKIDRISHYADPHQIGEDEHERNSV